MEELLTVHEVADYLRVSRTTVWRWCNEGKLKAFKIGRGWRIRRSELQRFMEEDLDHTEGERPALHNMPK